MSKRRKNDKYAEYAEFEYDPTSDGSYTEEQYAEFEYEPRRSENNNIYGEFEG